MIIFQNTTVESSYSKSTTPNTFSFNDGNKFAATEPTLSVSSESMVDNRKIENLNSNGMMNVQESCFTVS